GVGRFEIRTVDADAEPYLVADVEPLEDEERGEPAAEALVPRVTRRFVEYLRLLQPRDGEAVEPIDVQVEVEGPDDADEAEAAAESIEMSGSGAGLEAQADGGDAAATLRVPDDPSQLSFLLTGIIQVEPTRKQALLEAPTAEERLRGLDAVLDHELELL